MTKYAAKQPVYNLTLVILSTVSWSGAVIEKDANTTCENLNRGVQLLTCQQAISVQR